MPRFDYDEYITRLCDDSTKLREQFNSCELGSNEYKQAGNLYVRVMNSLGNALANERLHKMAEGGVKIDMPYEIVNRADTASD
jgi:hypothetical protein